MIAAHDNPLAALAFNSTGTKIATASEKVISLLGFKLTQEKFLIPRPKCVCVCVCYRDFICFLSDISGNCHPSILNTRWTETI